MKILTREELPKIENGSNAISVCVYASGIKPFYLACAKVKHIREFIKSTFRNGYINGCVRDGFVNIMPDRITIICQTAEIKKSVSDALADIDISANYVSLDAMRTLDTKLIAMNMVDRKRNFYCISRNDPTLRIYVDDSYTTACIPTDSTTEYMIEDRAVSYMNNGWYASSSNFDSYAEALEYAINLIERTKQ